MTRINVVPVEELCNEHLLGEYKEIVRPFNLVKAAVKAKRKVKIPDNYVLGTGHVLFFYDKLGYVAKRYQQLTDELIRRGYSPSPVPVNELLGGLPESAIGDYVPTSLAIKINQQRINERLSTMKKVTWWKNEYSSKI